MVYILIASLIEIAFSLVLVIHARIYDLLPSLTAAPLMYLQSSD